MGQPKDVQQFQRCGARVRMSHPGLTWLIPLIRGFLKLRVPFGGPNSKDYSILGSILGSPYFGKLPIRSRAQGCLSVG